MKNIFLFLFAGFLLLETAYCSNSELENGCIYERRKGTSINFSDQSCLTEEMKSTILESYPIESCMLDQTPLCEADLKFISTLGHIRNLSIVGCGLRRNNLSYLNIPSLEEFYISHNQLSLADFKSLRRTSNITVFHCWGIPIGDEGIKYLVSVMPKLKEVNIAGCNLKDESLNYLLMFNDLTKVILSRNTFSRAALELFQSQALKRNIEIVF